MNSGGTDNVWPGSFWTQIIIHRNNIIAVNNEYTHFCITLLNMQSLWGFLQGYLQSSVNDFYTYIFSNLRAALSHPSEVIVLTLSINTKDSYTLIAHPRNNCQWCVNDCLSCESDNTQISGSLRYIIQSLAAVIQNNTDNDIVNISYIWMSMKY